MKGSARTISIGLVGCSLFLYILTFRSYAPALWTHFSDRSQCGEPASNRTSTWSECGAFKDQIQSHVVLIKKNISKVYFSYTSLQASYVWASLLNEAHFINSTFTQNYISTSEFRRALFRGVTFQDSEVYESQFQNAIFDGVQFDATRFKNSDFSGAIFHGSRFLNCDLRNTRFQGADISDVVFLLTDLSNATFNEQTRLPFSKEVALARGMVYVE